MSRPWLQSLVDAAIMGALMYFFSGQVLWVALLFGAAQWIGSWAWHSSMKSNEARQAKTVTP